MDERIETQYNVYRDLKLLGVNYIHSNAVLDISAIDFGLLYQQDGGISNWFVKTVFKMLP